MNLAKIAKVAFSLALVAALSACMHHRGHHAGQHGGKGCCGMEACKSMKCEKSGACDKPCDKADCGKCTGEKSGCPFAGAASDGCKK